MQILDMRILYSADICSTEALNASCVRVAVTVAFQKNVETGLHLYPTERCSSVWDEASVESAVANEPDPII